MQMKMRSLMMCLFLLILSVCCYAADAPAKSEPAGISKTEPVAGNIKLDVKDAPIADVITSISAQSKQKILSESNVAGKLTLTVENLSVDAALSAVCKSGNLVWRKVYIDPKSELLDKPDRFAATLRLMAGLSFPDLVVAGASNRKIGVVCQQKQGVQDAQDKIVKDLGMEPVYLVSNDALVAAKEAQKNSAVSKYTDMAKKQLEMFMQMNPEEREQALLDSLNLMDNLGPDYYSSVMQTLMSSNPEALQRIQKRGTDMLFSMSTEQRRAMLKLQIQSSGSITPEQQQILAEDIKAIKEEMQNAQSHQ